MSPADIDAVLRHMNQHALQLSICGAITLVGGLIQFFEILRLGFRHKSHAVPLVVNLFWLANDVTYVALFSRWFHDVDAPTFRYAWFVWLPYMFLEAMIAWQIVTYSREEVFGTASRSKAWALYGFFQAGMVAFYLWVVEVLGDYFLQVVGVITVIGSNMGIALLLRRRSRKGQSMFLATTLLVNQGFISFFFFPAWSPLFSTPRYYAVATVTVLLGWLYWLLLWRTPAYDPHTAVDNTKNTTNTKGLTWAG